MGKKDIVKFDTRIVRDQFMLKVKEQYVERYATDMVNILEDKRKLEEALKKVEKTLEAVEEGDYSAIEKYKKARRVLEVEEDVSL